MDILTTSIVICGTMIFIGTFKGYQQTNVHPTNNIKKYGYLKNEVKTFKSKISGKEIKVIHYLNTNIYKVLDDELVKEFTEFNQREFFKYYE